MAKLAKTIEITRRGQREFSLSIDGEEFGYFLAREPITTTIDPNEPGTVNLTLVAEKVTVVDDWTFRNQHGSTDLSPEHARDLLDKQRAGEQSSEPESIKVDGDTVTLPHGHHEVREVLAAAGVNAQNYDLIRVDTGGQVITHRTGETVTTHRGDEFFTAAVSATT
jgi:hypothetical protein